MMLYRPKNFPMFFVGREFCFHFHSLSRCFCCVDSVRSCEFKWWNYEKGFGSCIPHRKYLELLVQTMSKVIHNGKWHRAMWWAIIWTNRTNSLYALCNWCNLMIIYLYACALSSYRLQIRGTWFLSREKDGDGEWVSETCTRHHRYGIRLLKIKARAKTIVITFICLPDISPNKKSFLSIFKRH